MSDENEVKKTSEKGMNKKKKIVFCILFVLFIIGVIIGVYVGLNNKDEKKEEKKDFSNVSFSSDYTDVGKGVKIKVIEVIKNNENVELRLAINLESATEKINNVGYTVYDKNEKILCEQGFEPMEGVNFNDSLVLYQFDEASHELKLDVSVNDAYISSLNINLNDSSVKKTENSQDKENKEDESKEKEEATKENTEKETENKSEEKN